MPFEQSPLARRVIGCAIDVHRAVGPGLLESAYQRCLEMELRTHSLNFERQVPVPLEFHDAKVPCAYRADFIVENELLVELKSVERLLGLYSAQVLTYLKLTGLRHGLLINFNVALLKYGIKSLINPRARPGGSSTLPIPPTLPSARD